MSAVKQWKRKQFKSKIIENKNKFKFIGSLLSCFVTNLVIRLYLLSEVDNKNSGSN